MGETENGFKPGFQSKVKGELEKKPLDIRKHVGKIVTIAKVTEVPRSPDGQGMGKYGPCVHVETEPVETIQKNDGTSINVKGSRLFSMFENDDGTLSWGKDMQNFLNEHKATHYSQLIGKKVQLQSKASKKDPATKFLTFE